MHVVCRIVFLPSQLLLVTIASAPAVQPGQRHTEDHLASAADAGPIAQGQGEGDERAGAQQEEADQQWQDGLRAREGR